MEIKIKFHSSLLVPGMPLVECRIGHLTVNRNSRSNHSRACHTILLTQKVLNEQQICDCWERRIVPYNCVPSSKSFEQ